MILLYRPNNLFHDLREMLHLQLVFLLGDVVDGVLRGECHTELGDDFASIADGRHPVYGYSRFRLSSCLHGLVNMMAPHSLAAIFRQQGRVDVDNLMREGINQKIRDER